MFNLKPLQTIQHYIDSTELDENLVELIKDKDLQSKDLGDGDYAVIMSWNIFQTSFKEDLEEMLDEQEDKYEPHFLKDFMNDFPLDFRQDPNKKFYIYFVF